MPKPGISSDKDNCSICGITAGNSYVCKECASKIEVAQNSTSTNKSSLKCTCAWEWPCMTVGDPDDTANIAFPDPECPVHNKP